MERALDRGVELPFEPGLSITGAEGENRGEELGQAEREQLLVEQNSICRVEPRPEQILARLWEVAGHVHFASGRRNWDGTADNGLAGDAREVGDGTTGPHGPFGSLELHGQFGATCFPLADGSAKGERALRRVDVQVQANLVAQLAKANAPERGLVRVSQRHDGVGELLWGHEVPAHVQAPRLPRSWDHPQLAEGNLDLTGPLAVRDRRAASPAWVPTAVVAQLVEVLVVPVGHELMDGEVGAVAAGEEELDGRSLPDVAVAGNRRWRFLGADSGAAHHRVQRAAVVAEADLRASRRHLQVGDFEEAGDDRTRSPLLRRHGAINRGRDRRLGDDSPGVTGIGHGGRRRNGRTVLLV